MNKLNVLLKAVVLTCILIAVATVGVYATAEGTENITIPDSALNEIGWSGLPLRTTTKYYTYTVADGEVSINDVDALIPGDVVIPSFIDGCPVTSIDDNAFYNCRSLTGVVIPDSVTTIGNSVFRNCTSLKSVTIPNSITSIGESAFSSCSSLMSVEIPDSVISIGNYAFSDCDSLACVKLPDSVVSIGSFAFNYCDNLVSVTVPQSVTSIGTESFRGCSKLVEVVNKSNLNIVKGSEDNGYIAYYAFEVHGGESKIINQNDYLFYTFDGVSYLLGYVGGDTELVLPESCDGHEYQINEYALYSYDNIISVTLSDGVTSIGDYAFSDCSQLTDVTLPNSVASIGISAFDFCYSLERVKIFAPDAEIYDSANTVFSSATIYGCTDSTAEAYAEKYNRKFVSLSEISFESKSVLNGCEMTVDISFARMPHVNSVLIENLVYDTELLELVKVEWNTENAAVTDWDVSNGTASATFEENTDCNGAVLKLTFNVKKEIWGETEITAGNIVLTRLEGNNSVPIRFSIVPGTVTVSECGKGDVNGDKSVNADDAIHLLRHTINGSKYEINQIGDMDGDGNINSDDAIYLLRHTLMPDKYPLK